MWKASISIKDSLNQELGQSASAKTPSPAKDDAASPENQSAKASQVPPDPDRILKAWQEYTASIEKKNPRVFSTLQNNRPVVSAEGVVRVLLNTEAQRDNFQKNIKGELTAFIREATQMTMVEIIPEVVEKSFEKKKIYTDQDRLEFMMKKNPELGKMKTRFGLDFDD